MYKVRPSSRYLRMYKRLVKKDVALKARVGKVLMKLRVFPYDPSLRTHKVIAKDLGEAWSSRVTSDIRIIWSFDGKDNLVILLLTMGGHSGKRKVYK